jgi:hypothetical protein
MNTDLLPALSESDLAQVMRSIMTRAPFLSTRVLLEIAQDISPLPVGILSLDDDAAILAELLSPPNN